MNQVSQDNYDKNYYALAYGESLFDEDRNCYVSRAIHIYDEVSRLLAPAATDFVVDYGCGNGDLSIYLASQYGCRIAGIDYSKAAIDICNNKKARIKNAENLTFINCNNHETPVFENVAAVILCDVVEHLHDAELATVINNVKAWGQGHPPKIVVHTDNRLYLVIVKPFFDLLHLALRQKTAQQIRDEHQLEKNLHVNLMTPLSLRRKMRSWGYSQTVLKYPDISLELIRRQLGGLARIPLLAELAYFSLRVLRGGSPTFYAVYECR